MSLYVHHTLILLRTDLILEHFVMFSIEKTEYHVDASQFVSPFFSPEECTPITSSLLCYCHTGHI